MTASERPDIAWADTNLFVSLFAEAAHPLHNQALRLFRRVADGSLRLIVTPVVIAELVHVTESLFDWQRSQSARRLGDLVAADGLDVREAAVLSQALDRYGARRRLDFVDAYLAASALTAGPPTVASLDRDFDRIDGVRRVS
ncbi:MAG: PIN domain-containing protein [Candidatus Limnocylindria bacterium]